MEYPNNLCTHKPPVLLSTCLLALFSLPFCCSLPVSSPSLLLPCSLDSHSPALALSGQLRAFSLFSPILPFSLFSPILSLLSHSPSPLSISLFLGWTMLRLAAASIQKTRPSLTKHKPCQNCTTAEHARPGIPKPPGLSACKKHIPLRDGAPASPIF